MPATPAYFEANGKSRVPPDLLRQACMRIRLPNRASHRWQFEKYEQPVQIDVDGPITLDKVSLTRIAFLTAWASPCHGDRRARGHRRRRLVRVMEGWTPPSSLVWPYYVNRRNPSAAFRAFIDMARSLAA
jgi:DNA-binding transcriptional LysR family regulator